MTAMFGEMVEESPWHTASNTFCIAARLDDDSMTSLLRAYFGPSQPNMRGYGQISRAWTMPQRLNSFGIWVGDTPVVVILTNDEAELQKADCVLSSTKSVAQNYQGAFVLDGDSADFRIRRALLTEWLLQTFWAPVRSLVTV